MRLINTALLELQEFVDSQDLKGKYAILSHCWGDSEVSMQAFKESGTRQGLGWEKILRCCEIANEQGLEWAWVDTCCIDKTSSAELSEAINSMYRWYEEAAVCYAFLTDVHVDTETVRPRDHDLLSQSRWFTRGWTLQELLAPANVVFYDSHYLQFGTRDSMGVEIARITGIDERYLLKKADIQEASIACRMSWASNRKTTRTEDTAYCLLGLFAVNMPLLYGEGRGAFRRLQETIMAHSDDDSLFAWVSDIDERRGLLAHSPKEFARSRYIQRSSSREFSAPFEKTNRGTQITGKAGGLLAWMDRLVADVQWCPDYRRSEKLPRVSMVYVLNCQLVDPDDPAPRSLLIPLRRTGFMGFGGGTLTACRIRADSLLACRSSFHLAMLQMHYLGQIVCVTEPVQGKGARQQNGTALLFLAATWFPVLNFGVSGILACVAVITVFEVGATDAGSVAVPWAILTLGYHLTHYKLAYIYFGLVLSAVRYFGTEFWVYLALYGTVGGLAISSIRTTLSSSPEIAQIARSRFFAR